MSKSNLTETDVLEYFFNASAFSWDAITNLWISLHTASCGEASAQSTNEATYTGYTRIGVARSSTGWTVSGNQASNAALIQFPICTGGADTLTDVSIGTASAASAGSEQILYTGGLNSDLSVSNGIQPQFSIGALTVEED
jgi:hypothetical protein